MKKIYALVVALAVISATAVGFAQMAEIYPSPAYPAYYSDDFPDVLVMKGVAVKGDNVKSAVFLATDREEGYKFKSSYLLLEGKSHELELEDFDVDEKTRTVILRFETEDDKVFKLVIKVHRFNYQEIATASGVFDGHILNLRLVGEYDQVYRIMQPLYEKQYGEAGIAAVEKTAGSEGLTAEEIAAIEEAIR